MTRRRRELVMRDLRDAIGLTYRAVRLRRGCLTIVGHDLGGMYDEYEFERRLSRAETARLAASLGVRTRGLLDAIEERFGDPPELEQHCGALGLEGRFGNGGG